MAEADTAWVMYTADYDTGRQHSRIIPESVRVLRTSTREIGADELQAERERASLSSRLHTIQIDVPHEVTGENLAAYAERYISLEPGFDFWEDVIGDDIVVAGIAYDGDRYAPDGEGGVRPLTEAEQAAREATIRQREAEREAEQTAREAQRRQQAIDYATTSAAHQQTRQDAAVADNAIGLFMQYQASGIDIADAQREATVEAAWDHAVEARSKEPLGAYLPGTVPALPALAGFHMAENAIEEFMSLRQSGLEPGAARELAVKRAGTPELEHRSAHNPEAELELDQTLADAPNDVRDAYWQARDRAPAAELTRTSEPEHRSAHNREAELELDQTLADAPDDVRDAYWQARDRAGVDAEQGRGGQALTTTRSGHTLRRDTTPSLVAGLRQRAANLHAELDNNPTAAWQHRSTSPGRHDLDAHLPAAGAPAVGAEDLGAAPSSSPDVGP